MNLDDLKKSLLEELQNEDVSDTDPLYPAFEVEDVPNRRNYVFSNKGDHVAIFNSSRGVNKLLLERIWRDKFSGEFPFGQKTASDYHKVIFHKALRAEDNICFIGYVRERESFFEPVED